MTGPTISIIVGIQRRGVQLAARIVRTIAEREKVEGPAGRPRHHALSRRSPNRRPAARRRPDAISRGHRRQARRDRRRRALHRAARFARRSTSSPTSAGQARSRWPCSIDRGGRELPIQPDIVGKKIVDATPAQRVDVLVEELDGRDAVVVVARDGSARRDAARSARTCSASSRSRAEQIRSILDTAEPFKEISERAIKKVPALRGATIVNLFFEASTRTRISFEFAEKRLSADTVNVASSGSSVSEGRDARRHGAQSRGDADRHGRDPPRRVGRGAVPRRAHRVERHQRRRRHARASDAGAARPAHAARSLRDARGAARSASSATCCTRASRARTSGDCKKMGAEVAVCGPRSLLPNAIDELGVTVFDRVEEAIEWADALNILRLQLERMTGAATSRRCANTIACSACRASGSSARRATFSFFTRVR